jgi:hypothetical protein
VRKGNVRYCEVCDSVIAKGKRFAVCIIPQHSVETARGLLECKGTIDSSGNLRFDVCLECRMHMNLTGDVTVN